MRTEDIIRAWKDEAFRDSLGLDHQAQLPEHPAGLVELTEEDLDSAAGGTSIIPPLIEFVTWLIC